MKELSSIIPLEANLIVYLIGIGVLLIAAFYTLISFWKWVRSGIILTFWLVSVVYIASSIFPDISYNSIKSSEFVSKVKDSEWVNSIAAALHIKI